MCLFINVYRAPKDKHTHLYIYRYIFVRIEFIYVIRYDCYNICCSLMSEKRLYMRPTNLYAIFHVHDNMVKFEVEFPPGWFKETNIRYNILFFG